MAKVYKDAGRTILVSADGKHQVMLSWGKGYPLVDLPKSHTDDSTMTPDTGQTDPRNLDLLEDASVDPVG